MGMGIWAIRVAEEWTPGSIAALAIMVAIIALVIVRYARRR